MRYISLCSGIEAATLAWEPLGWEPVAFAEIDEFPSAVLSVKYPDVPNLGDFTKVDWSKYRGTVNLVAGGFPCQSYSLAGNRGGLADPRGSLALEFLRAAKEIDPEWVVGENVPGLLSSAKGGDFQTILETVADFWPGGGVSWRVLDAEFTRVPIRGDSGEITGWFGPVPQRRRRLFLVINTRDWRRAAAVHSQQSSMFGDPREGRSARSAIAADTQGGPRRSSAGGGSLRTEPA